MLTRRGAVFVLHLGDADAVVTGRRYGGLAAAAAGLVDEVAAESAVLELAVSEAERRSPQAGPTLAAIKTRMYGDIADTLKAENEAGAESLNSGLESKQR